MGDPVGDALLAPSGEVSQRSPAPAARPGMWAGRGRRTARLFAILVVLTLPLFWQNCQNNQYLYRLVSYYEKKSGRTPAVLLESLHTPALCRALDGTVGSTPQPGQNEPAHVLTPERPALAALHGGCAPLLDAHSRPLPAVKSLLQRLTPLAGAPPDAASPMPSTDAPLLRFQLHLGVQPGTGVVCGGIPIPERLALHHTDGLAVREEGGEWLPLQVMPLARWGGVPVYRSEAPLRWIRICIQSPTQAGNPTLPSQWAGGRRPKLALYRVGPHPQPRDPLVWDLSNPNSLALGNGHWRIESAPKGDFPLELRSTFFPDIALKPETTGSSAPVTWRPDSLRLVQTGTLEAVFRLDGTARVTPEATRRLGLPARDTDGLLLEHTLELRLRAGEPLLHLTHHVLNPQKAHHPGNTWPVLDFGTLPLPPVRWKLSGIPAAKEARFQVDGQMHVERAPFFLMQGWPLPTPRPEARAPLNPPVVPGPGVELTRTSTGGEPERLGLRLESGPELLLKLDGRSWHAALDAYDLWTRSPTTCTLEPDTQPGGGPTTASGDQTFQLLLSRAPAEAREVLQGGELAVFRLIARLEEAAVQGAADTQTPGPSSSHLPRLAEASDMLLTPDSSTFLIPDPQDFLEARGAFVADVPALTPVTQGLAATALAALIPQGRSPRSLSRTAYRHGAIGWREFGEVQADHETRCGVDAFEDDTFVSNYNNQYDLIASAWHACGRSAKSAWCTLATYLGRHTAEIDVYHTRQDRPEWNGGLFWHTTHDTPAGDGTHRGWPSRTYSNGCTSWQSGGPGLGHLYVDGLLLGWLQLNDATHRDAAFRQGELALYRWKVDPSERDGRAVANTLRSLLSLCEVTGLDVVCQGADEVALSQPLPDPASISGPLWMHVMQADVNLRWLDHLAQRARTGIRPLPSNGATRSLESWLHALCTTLSSGSPDKETEIHALRSADVLSGCAALPSTSSEDARRFRLHAALQISSLEARYWARGTYSNAKELALLLSSGGRFRVSHRDSR